MYQHLAAPSSTTRLPAPSSCPQPHTAPLLLRFSTATDLHVWANPGGYPQGAAWGQAGAAARGQVGAARGQLSAGICPHPKTALTCTVPLQGAEGAGNYGKFPCRDLSGNGHYPAFGSQIGRSASTAESLRARLPLLPPGGSP